MLYTLYLKSSNKVENQFDKLEKGLELWRKRDDDKTRFEFIRLRTPSEVFLYWVAMRTVYCYNFTQALHAELIREYIYLQRVTFSDGLHSRINSFRNGLWSCKYTCYACELERIKCCTQCLNSDFIAVLQLSTPDLPINDIMYCV